MFHRLFPMSWWRTGSSFKLGQFYNKLHRWADGQKQGNNAQELMFNCCPLSQTGSPFALRRKGKIVFIRKYTLGKKNNQNPHVAMESCSWAAEAAVEEQPSSPHTLWLGIDQLQVDVLAEQGTGGAGQARGWPCCHVQSPPTEPQQVCLLQQLCNTKGQQSAQPGASHSCPTVSSCTILSSRKSSSAGKMALVQKYLVFITQRGCLVCCGN